MNKQKRRIIERGRGMTLLAFMRFAQLQQTRRRQQAEMSAANTTKDTVTA